MTWDSLMLKIRVNQSCTNLNDMALVRDGWLP